MTPLATFLLALVGTIGLGAQLVTTAHAATPRALLARCVGCQLPNMDLRGADLHGVHFVGDDLRGADLRHANLRGAVFEGTVLTGANFDRADLREARFLGSTIDRATFAEANTEGATIVGTAPAAGGPA